MSLLVVKFGGTSVADLDRIKHAAGKVAAEVYRGHQVVVVVSAMSGQTDHLLGLCRGIAPLYDPAEADAVVASGEQVTSGLMALALQQRGLAARSFHGWQVPISTDGAHSKARITAISPVALRTSLARGEVPVVAGFQGLSPDDRITTLGRGGSDTSAVALAAALKAERCDIYTDVDGVYTADPRLVTRARKLDRIAYEEMLELASLGAKVLHTRSVEMAVQHRVALQVLSTFANAIGSDLPGTVLTQEDHTMESNPVTGIAHSRDEARIALRGIPDRPGIASAIFGPLATAGINVDMIAQTASPDSKLTEMTFSLHRNDVPAAIGVLENHRRTLAYTALDTDTNVMKISVVGTGMRSHPGVAALMFKTLADKGVNIQVISTSEIKISVLIAEDYAELALRALHHAYGLDAPQKTQTTKVKKRKPA